MFRGILYFKTPRNNNNEKEIRFPKAFKPLSYFQLAQYYVNSIDVITGGISVHTLS